MEKKYELTNETITFYGKKLYRIRALKDFGDINKGELGGFIEKEENLSQEGICWVCKNAKAYGSVLICDNAKVCGNAKVADDAMVCGNAQVLGNAVISERARIGGNAKVYDNAIICGNAKVDGNAIISEKARIGGNAKVYDRAHIYNNAKIGGNAIVCNTALVTGNALISGNTQIWGDAIITDNAVIKGNAKVYDNAIICGNAKVDGNAIIKEDQHIKTGHCTVDLSKNLKENIRCQTNLFPQKDYVIAYKMVRKDLTSFYDDDFQYKIGEWAEAENPDMSAFEGCSSGLHFSNVNYWNSRVNSGTFLMAKIMYDDIITIQSGKIRCKRAFIIDKYDIEDN